MKKLMIIVTICTSLFLFILQYRLANYNEAYVSYNYPDYMADIIGLKQCPMEFVFNNEADGKRVINVINQFVKENKYTYLVSYYETLSQGRERWKQIVYSSHEDILSRLYVEIDDKIDFSNTKDYRYYSTEENDINSSGYIRVLDKQWFNKFGFIYQFETPVHLEEYLKKDLTLYYYFFSNNHDIFYKKLSNYLKEKLPNTHFTINDYTNGYAESKIMPLDDVLLENSQDIIILLVAFFIGSSFIIVLHKSREIMIKKMLGTSTIKIFIKSFLKLFVICWIIYLVTQFILLYVYMDQYNWLFSNFINSLLNVYKLYSFSLGVLIILTYIYIKFLTNIIILKKTSFKEMVYIQNIVKICIILLVVIPFINSYNNVCPAITRYIGIKTYENELKNSVNIITENDDKLFNYLNKNGKFVDFTEHISLYKDYVYDNWHDLEKDEIDEFALSYPKITANVTYLMDYNIKDEFDNDICYEKFQEDILLVPIEYKNCDELERYKHGTKQIVYIKNNGNFFDLSLQNPIVYVENPIIHVTIENSQYFKTNYLYCSTKDKSIEKYYKDIKTMINNNNFDIYDRSKEIDIYIMDIKNDMFQFIFIFFMYFIILLLFIYLTVYVFIHESGKKLYIQYTLGHTYIQRYKKLLFIVMLSYFIPLTIFMRINLSVKINQIVQFLLIFFIFEVILEIVYVYNYLKYNGISILKGEGI